MITVKCKIYSDNLSESVMEEIVIKHNLSIPPPLSLFRSALILLSFILDIQVFRSVLLSCLVIFFLFSRQIRLYLSIISGLITFFLFSRQTRLHLSSASLPRPHQFMTVRYVMTTPSSEPCTASAPLQMTVVRRK